MIKYLGSKRTLLPHILRLVQSVAPSPAPDRGVVLDLFSGTSRVGHALKRAGYRVLANDHNAYAHALARCYVEADRDEVLDDAARLIAEFNALPPRCGGGYFTHVFCDRARFIHPKNGERIDAIRDAIRSKSLPPVLEAVVLVSLMEAADRVDSTTGLQMAYLKAWAARARNDLHLRVPDLLPRAAAGAGAAHCLDALDAARTLEGDVAYIDPPYNQHSYLGNYHVWETLVRWDTPEFYGEACKRTDCTRRKSPFNSRRTHASAFAALVDAVRAPVLIVSFSDEGFLPRAEVEGLLARRGEVRVLAHDYPRYVGARIGIHNPRGEKVGAVGRLRNTEFLYIAGPAHILGPAALPDAPAPHPA